MMNFFKTEPVRLGKKMTREDYRRSLNLWVYRNYGIVAIATTLTLLIVFVIFCWALVGVSAVESGGMRNFIAGGV